MRRRAFDNADVARLREVPLEVALEGLGLDMRRDRDFVPQKNSTTERWYVSVGAGVFELLVTGAKWYDARDRRGGGGAVDLTMHLMGVDFVSAVKRLKAHGL
jgi:hypothetical protein